MENIMEVNHFSFSCQYADGLPFDMRLILFAKDEYLVAWLVATGLAKKW